MLSAVISPGDPCVFCRAMITTSACKLWSSWPRCLVQRIQSSLHRTNLSGSATLGGTAHAQHVQRPVSLCTQTGKKGFNRKIILKDFDHLRLLWFLRFNDIHVPVRLECVKFASHCLMNHPDLAKDLTGTNCSPSNFDYSYALTKIINAKHLFLPLFFMSWTQRSKNFYMYTKGLFLSNIFLKSV